MQFRAARLCWPIPAEAEGLEVTQVYEEIETGSGADALERRPKLAAALTKVQEAKPFIDAMIDAGKAIKDLVETIKG